MQKILDDKTSGSEELLIKLNGYLYHCISPIENPLQFIKELKNLFPTFQAIRSYLNELEKNSGNKKELISFIQKKSQKKFESINSIYKSAEKYLKTCSKLLTISNSWTVTEIIKKLYSDKNNLTIFISESRPMFEGRITAANLSVHKIKTELITEARTAVYVQKCDAAIIGADKILEDGSVINKAGSLNIAIACKHYSKPFYVVAREVKRISENSFEEIEQGFDEIWHGKLSEVVIKNFYFERIPSELISRIFTDSK
ncbi:MAG: hypothetical protein V1720_09220 [bacterium]